MKLLLTCTSGGHFATMKDLKSFWSKHERVWVTHAGHDTEVISQNESVYFLPYQGPRELVPVLRNFSQVLKIIFSEKPDMIVSTGASIAVSFAIAAKLLGVRFIYVESISRSEDLSLSGKLVYHLADDFYVQWPHLTHKYGRSQFAGYV